MTVFCRIAILFAAMFLLSPAMAQDHSSHHASPEHLLSGKKSPTQCGMSCCSSGHDQSSDAPKCKQGCCGAHKDEKSHDMAGMTAPLSPWEKQGAQAMMAMHENMAQPYTGDPDADFIRGMIPHHQGAVEMARIVLQYGDDETAKDLARRIIVAQKGEIAWMQRWLRQRQIPEQGAFYFNK